MNSWNRFLCFLFGHKRENSDRCTRCGDPNENTKPGVF